jgi:hypothetical protein
MGRPRKKRDGTWEEPAALRHLRSTLTDEMKLREFRKVFNCEPSSDQDLDFFIEELTREMYNAGRDEWPEERHGKNP